MRKLLVIVAVLIVTACATMSTRDRAVRGIQFTDQRLSAFQDAERRICNEAEYVKIGGSLTTPILTCAGPLAEAAGLSTEVHRKIAMALAEAFALQKKAAALLLAWEENQPAPPELNTLLAQAQATLQIVSTLAPTERQKELLSLGNAVVTEIQKILDLIRSEGKDLTLAAA